MPLRSYGVLSGRVSDTRREGASDHVARLLVRVARRGGRRPADRDVAALPHRARVGGGFLEAAALAIPRGCHPRNVIVFSVVMLPLPAFRQISKTAEPMSPLASKSTGLNAPS